MKRIRAFSSLSLLCAVASLEALPTKPWLPEPYCPGIDVSYTYSSYSKVAEATHQLKSRSHDQCLAGGVGLSTATDWAADLEVEAARTPRTPFSLRSVGAQMRKQLFNDICGDLASLTLGGILRIVPPKPLRDVSTPYHYKFNFELNASLGKEWSKDFFWRVRLYNFLGLGIANRGAPWVRDLLSLTLNREDELHFRAFLLYYRGFGDQMGVNTKTTVFNGWKVIDHRSLDIGFSICKLFGIYGALTFEVAHRLYARSFPEHVTFFTLRYELPLSL